MSTAITTSRALDAFKSSATIQSSFLRCNNPKCWHLFEHVYEGDNVSFKPKVDDDGSFTAATVEVNMNGKQQTYYRMQPGDRIYLANRAGDVAIKDNLDVNGNYICGECHDEGCHIAAKGLCRCALDEMGDAATPSGRATRGAAEKFKPPTVADPSGPMLRGLMAINDNSFKDHATIVKLSEEAEHEMRDREGTGGTAQRKAVIKKRIEDAQAIKAEAAAKINKVNAAGKELEETRHRLKEENKLLNTYIAGYTMPDDAASDDDVDVGDEDAEDASTFYKENGEDVGKLRSAFPLHAKRWYGAESTDEDIAKKQKDVEDTQKEIAEQEKELKLLTKEQDEAKEKFEVVAKETEDLEKQMVADYEDDADGAKEPAKPKKSGKAKMKPEDMTPEQLAEYNIKREIDADKRRESTKIRREKIEAYDDLLLKAKKYEDMKKSARIYREEMNRYKSMADEKSSELGKAHNRIDDFKEAVLGWFEDANDKPDKWDSKAMFVSYAAHTAAVTKANQKKRKAEAKANAEAEAKLAKAANSDEDEE